MTAIKLKFISSNKPNHPGSLNLISTSNKNYVFIHEGEPDFYFFSIDETPHHWFWQTVEHALASNIKYFFLTESSYYFNRIDPRYINHACFCGYISHVKSTAEDIGPRMGYPSYHLPPGVKSISDEDIAKKFERLNNTNELTCLFWGSFNDQHNTNFFNRGGLYVIEIFKKLKAKGYKNLKLNLKCSVEIDFDEECKGSLRQIWSELFTEQKLYQIHLDSDLLFLPALQAHMFSLPYAMSFGLPCIGNYNWGYVPPDNYIIDNYNGFKSPAKPMLTTRPDNFYRLTQTKYASILTETSDAFKSVQTNDIPFELGQRALLEKIDKIDLEYVESMATKIESLLNDRNKLILMTENTIKTQRRLFNIDNYEPNIMSILENYI